MSSEGTEFSQEFLERVRGKMFSLMIVILGTAIRVGRGQGLTASEIRRSILGLDVLGEQQIAALMQEFQISREVVEYISARVCEKLLEDMLPEESL